MTDPRGKSDAELVSLASKGDRVGLEGLVERYKGHVYNFLLRILGDPERAQDVFQDVFLAVFRDLGSFKEGRSFRNWILGIAVNLARQEWSAVRPQTGLDADAQPGTGDDPAVAAQGREMSQIVRLGVGELSPEHREVFLLRTYHGMKYAEISEILHISEGTAKSRMHYAVTTLRRYLKRF